MWRQIDKGGGKSYKMTKWFHDLYRPSLRPYDPEEIDIIKHVNAQMDAELKGESLRAKIAKKFKIERQDMWHGYRRTQFDFRGRTAWIVEPSIAPRKDAAWIWNMLWADCNVERMQVAELLKRGFHYAYIELFDTRMDDAGVTTAAEFQDFLVKELGCRRTWRKYTSTTRCSLLTATHHPPRLGSGHGKRPLLQPAGATIRVCR